MTADINHSQKADRSRYLYLGLMASLAVNLLFVGLVGAGIWHHKEEEEKPKELGFMSFIQRLPADHQEAIRAKVMAARAASKDLRTTVRTSWVEANSLLTAEPFDKEKFLAALMRLRVNEDNLKNAIYNSIASTAEQLTPDERKLLQAWREERHAKILKPFPQDDEKAKSGEGRLTD